MTSRQTAIEAMRKYHEAYKNNNELNGDEVNRAVNSLSESDKTFIVVSGSMENLDQVYPVSDVLSDKYTLADLVMAYHYYLQEAEEDTISKDILIVKVDKFYKKRPSSKDSL